jgi:hypothetical protein
MRLYIYTRQGVDEAGRDDVGLMGNEPFNTYASGVEIGHLVFEELTAHAMDDWTPLAVNGSAMTIGPYHPMDSAGGPPERDPMKDAGFIRSTQDYEINYVNAIDPIEPPT